MVILYNSVLLTLTVTVNKWFRFQRLCNTVQCHFGTIFIHVFSGFLITLRGPLERISRDAARAWLRRCLSPSLCVKEAKILGLRPAKGPSVSLSLSCLRSVIRAMFMLFFPVRMSHDILYFQCCLPSVFFFFLLGWLVVARMGERERERERGVLS